MEIGFFFPELINFLHIVNRILIINNTVKFFYLFVNTNSEFRIEAIWLCGMTFLFNYTKRN